MIKRIESEPLAAFEEWHARSRGSLCEAKQQQEVYLDAALYPRATIRECRERED